VVTIDGTQAVFINCTKPPPQPIDETSWLSTAVAIAAPIALAVAFPAVGAALLGAAVVGSWLSS
jgi:hypothetical protein